MPPPRSRHAPPRASAMVEALRGLGYSTAGALADLIDNSISAHATSVKLAFSWSGGAPSVVVTDDGTGMDAQELDRAMRLGERSPLEVRPQHDLGRFGLGLKTASFSQCRKLTVGSRKDGATNCLRWDLDILAASDDDGWHLMEGPTPESAKHVEALSAKTGTVVVWEALDRIVTPGFNEQSFLDLIDRVDRHLGMVFHRILARENAGFRIWINDRPVDPWEPFLEEHESTWSSPVFALGSAGGKIEVQCHVLPHRDRLAGPEYEAAAGPDGWTSQQGFYVYRNQRLLVGGTWLGLGRGRAWTKEEAHRLARIRLDLPNSADFDWKIDIRKSSARPPAELRDHLTRLAEDARARARRVFAHRGQAQAPSGNTTVQAVWRAEAFGGTTRYRIDESHESVRAVMEAAGESIPQVRAMLRLIAETLPVQRIWLDTAEAKETPRARFFGEPPAEVLTVLRVLYHNMVHRRHIPAALARAQLQKMEPFDQFPLLINELPDNPDQPEQEQ